MNKKIINIFVQILLIGLAVYLVYISMQDFTKEKWIHLKEVFSTGNYWLVIPASIIILFSHWFRAIRWQLLIKANDLTTKNSNTFFCVMIGYFANSFLPRFGEVVRCSTLSKQEKVPVSNLLGTILVERTIDMISLGILFILALGLSFATLSEYVYTHYWKGIDKTSLFIKLIIGLVVLGLIVFSIVKILSKSKNNFVKKIVSFFYGIKDGVIAVKKLKGKKLFILYTLLIWGCYLLPIYIAFFAFLETSHLSIIVALVVLAVGAVGMILTPGGIGAYPLLVQSVLLLYAIPDEIGLGMGWVMWILQTAIILLVGGFGLVRWYIIIRTQKN